jgi:hypothetical protein
VINLRYHIVSIVAVFLALGIGLALGSTFVDSFLVNELEDQVNEFGLEKALAIEEKLDAEEMVFEINAELDEIKAVVRETLPEGKLDGSSWMILAPESLKNSEIFDLEMLLSRTSSEFYGFLWVNESLDLSDIKARNTVASELRLSSNSLAAVTKGLTFFIAKTLLDAKNIEGVTGLGSEPVITQLIRAGLLTYQGSKESQIGNSNIGLLLVSDVANNALNQNLFLPLLKKIVDEGLAGSTVAIEMATADSLTDEFVEEVRSDPQLASSVSTANDVNSFMGQIVLLSSLENLPIVTHYDETLFLDTVKSK